MTTDNNVTKHNNLQRFTTVSFFNAKKEGVEKFPPRKWTLKEISLTNTTDEV